MPANRQHYETYLSENGQNFDNITWFQGQNQDSSQNMQLKSQHSREISPEFSLINYWVVPIITFINKYQQQEIFKWKQFAQGDIR